jgi:hypothetical protein
VEAIHDLLAREAQMKADAANGIVPEDDGEYEKATEAFRVEHGYQADDSPECKYWIEEFIEKKRNPDAYRD